MEFTLSESQLPLSYSALALGILGLDAWVRFGRTKSLSQSQLPYHLATTHYIQDKVEIYTQHSVFCASVYTHLHGSHARTTSVYIFQHLPCKYYITLLSCCCQYFNQKFLRFRDQFLLLRFLFHRLH